MSEITMDEKIRAVEKRIRDGADAIAAENRLAAEKEEREMIENYGDEEKDKDADEESEKFVRVMEKEE